MFQRLLAGFKLSPEQKKLMKLLGLPMKSASLFLQALTHPSFTAEHSEQSYQRLEFLGDAIIGAYMAMKLYNENPNWQEGKLTRARASVVSMSGLAKAGRQLGLQGFLRLGKGEQASGGKDKDTILADAFESLVATVALSRGIGFAFKTLQRLNLFSEATEIEDPKSQLQQIAQRIGKITPSYRIISAEGPSHCMRFEAQVQIGDICKAFGKGNSKQEAEQEAARRALKIISELSI